MNSSQDVTTETEIQAESTSTGMEDINISRQIETEKNDCERIRNETEATSTYTVPVDHVISNTMYACGSSQQAEVGGMYAEAESKSVETGDITIHERTSSQQNDDEETVGTETISTYTVTVARGFINTMYGCGSPGQTEDEEQPAIPTEDEEGEIECIDADDPKSHVYQSVDEDDIENRRQARMDGENGQQPTDKKEDTTLPIKARKKATGLRNNPLYASGEQVKKKVVTQDSSWVVNSTGTPYVNDGVIYDAGKALDGDIETYWNPIRTAQFYNNWLIVLDLAAPTTLTSIAVIHWGHTNHDIAKFKLQKSEAVCPYNWEDVVYITDVQGGTDQHQQFGGFQGTARYWRFVVTRTHTGWQPWLNELYLYPITTHCQVGDGASYRGTVSVTDTGITCQRWDSQTPHGHDMTPADYVSSGLEKNYCRNPDGEAGVWCYTMDPSTRWTYCKVPVCAARSARCPVGYRLIARTCIKFDFRLKSYRTAEAACKWEGAELALPKTKELDVALRILVRTESHRQSFWFGLKNKGGFLLHQRNWQWADGSSLGNYKSWNPGEPSFTFRSTCVLYCSVLSGCPMWDAEYCDKIRRFICQTPLT
ncbi:uncharacterized protein [Branchiostoma lanceolatum]|uniref:uncharacterized protein n=1 Tax=Branchiostoma lanceolatum TaxID=7740 RepID=UPI0034522C02